MTRKRKRRKSEQIVKLLQQGHAMLTAGKSESGVFLRLGITQSTWQRWKKQFGGMKSDEAVVAVKVRTFDFPCLGSGLLSFGAMAPKESEVQTVGPVSLC